MKTGKNGWLKEYLDYRINHYHKDVIKSSIHPDYSLYNLLQPTGLLYGKPIQAENLEQTQFTVLNEHDRMEALLAESLLNASLLFHEKEIKNAEDFSRILFKTVANITDFYNKVYPEIAVNTKTLFGSQRSTLETTEKILKRRLDKMSETSGKFWVHFFYNTLVFLDIYLFGQWIHTGDEKVLTAFFIQEKEELRLTVIKILVAAAYANDILELEEKKMFEYLLHAAQLSGKTTKEAKKYLEQGVQVEEITLPQNNSWLLKKYFLEIAILTVWADRVVDDKELAFLKRLNSHLGFFDDDFNKSMMAIESFVLEHWKEMGDLQSNKSFDALGKEFEKKVLIITKRNEGQILQEIKGNEKITRLVRKYRNNDLSDEDTERLRNMLMNILQNLPAFGFIALPDTYLTLPLLFKILPEELMSAPQ